MSDGVIIHNSLCTYNAFTTTTRKRNIARRLKLIHLKLERWCFFFPSCKAIFYNSFPINGQVSWKDYANAKSRTLHGFMTDEPSNFSADNFIEFLSFAKRTLGSLWKSKYTRASRACGLTAREYPPTCMHLNACIIRLTTVYPRICATSFMPSFTGLLMVNFSCPTTSAF